MSSWKCSLIYKLWILKEVVETSVEKTSHQRAQIWWEVGFPKRHGFCNYTKSQSIRTVGDLNHAKPLVLQMRKLRPRGKEVACPRAHRMQRGLGPRPLISSPVGFFPIYYLSTYLNIEKSLKYFISCLFHLKKRNQIIVMSSKKKGWVNSIWLFLYIFKCIQM